jgi:hypothetical protein
VVQEGPVWAGVQTATFGRSPVVPQTATRASVQTAALGRRPLSSSTKETPG